MIEVIIIIIVIAFFPRLISGIIGALILGWFGSLFGEIGLIVGGIFGFISGISSGSDEQKVHSSNRGQKNTGTQDSRSQCTCGSGKRYENCHGLKKERVNTQSNNEHIIRCPSCTQKIRIILPLKSENAKCSSCSTQFKIKMDQNNQPYAERINNSSYTQNTKASDYTECFNILGIKKTSDFTEIKRAYKKRIREYHPDKVGNLGDKIKIIAEEESKSINMAYSVLRENFGV